MWACFESLVHLFMNHCFPVQLLGLAFPGMLRGMVLTVDPNQKTLVWRISGCKVQQEQNEHDSNH